MAARGLLSCGTLAPQLWHACGIYFPDQGLNPGPLHWEHGVLTTVPPGKSLIRSFVVSDKPISDAFQQKGKALVHVPNERSDSGKVIASGMAGSWAQGIEDVLFLSLHCLAPPTQATKTEGEVGGGLEEASPWC